MKEKDKENTEEEEHLLQRLQIYSEDNPGNLVQEKITSNEQSKKEELDDNDRIKKGKKLLQDAKTGNTTSVDILLKEGCVEVDCCDDKGQTALHLAANSLHTAVCKSLVESNKDLLKKMDRKGNTPLHLSISSGKSSTKIVELFLVKKADPRILTRKRQNTLHIASEKGNVDIVKLLINQKEFALPIEDKDCEGFTALHLAAKNGYTHCCEALFIAGAQLNAKCTKGQTPLHLAAKMRFTLCCTFLLKSGADINLQDGDGNTPLHLVCSMRTNRGPGELVKCVSLLIENKADPNILNKQDENALQAAKRAPIDVLKEFNNTPVKVTQTDVKGQTILHHVAESKETSACDLILNLCKQLEEDVIKFVNQQDEENSTALHFSIKSRNTESCRTLIKYGADVNICSSRGNALHIVAESGHDDICDLIITKGAKIDAVNSKNETALQVAAQKGHTKICRYILNKKSNVMLTDSEGNTALHLAAMKGYTECCQLLVDKNKLAINKENKAGKTPLDVAIINGMPDCCKVFTNETSELWKRGKNVNRAVLNSYEYKQDSIFLLLVNSPKIGLVKNDIKFNDILNSALKGERRVVCDGLIKSEIWEECFKRQPVSENDDSENLDNESENKNFREIIKDFPDHAKSILDKCQTKVQDVEDMKTTYNFTYIDDTTPKYEIDRKSGRIGAFFNNLIFGWSNINSSWRANHPITLMRKKPNLLQHPVVTQWTKYKWVDYGWVLHYSNILFILLQLYLLLSYFIKSWTWNTVWNEYQLNQTAVCPNGPRLVGPEVEKSTIENNRVATDVGYALITFSVLRFISLAYRIFRIPSSISRFKTILVLLTGISNILLVFNFTQCSWNTHLREDIQWLPGYASSGFILLILILTFGEHPNSSKIFFDFNNACQGLKCLIPLLVVIVLSSVYYQFSEHIKNMINIEPPTLWIILILLISVIVLLSSFCNQMIYVRNRQRRLAFVHLIMDHDVLFPPLRNWNYRKDIIIEQEYKNCLSINSMMCSPQDEDESYEGNAFEENLLDKVSKMESGLTDDISKLKEQLETISNKIDAKT